MLSKSLVTAAAGNAGGDKIYIEDVFSPHLYIGTGQPLIIENGIALGDTNYGPAVEFDGVDDFLSRSTALTGAVDSKTFTASFWVFRNPVGTSYLLAVQNFYLIDYTTTGIRVRGSNGSGIAILDFYIPQASLPLMQWSHVLVSINLASTSQRHVYVNDSPVSITYTTYTNDSLDFTGTYLYVGNAAATTFRGRLSNVYLDTTYRDLSVEANRRIFITADDQPTTGLASLNPIIYFPFDDTTPITTNLGTGGDYVINGAPKVLSIGGPYTESGYGQGGLIWFKQRSSTSDHALYDTERGVTKRISSNNTGILTDTTCLTSFNSNGFTLAADATGEVNGSGNNYVSWTFRKAPKFFDIVTYTGTGSVQNISHNLGSVPGCIIIKCLTVAGAPAVYHRGNTAQPETERLYLSSTVATADDITFWNDTAPTDSVFTVGTEDAVNRNGALFVAYLFAHNDGGFGDDDAQNVITCGSYTGTGSDNNIVTLGYEPQWILIKRTNTTGGWMLVDSIRGISTDRVDPYLQANEIDVEGNTLDIVDLTATGFSLQGAGASWNASGSTYIYIAIRRGPMKTPDSSTKVFGPVATGSGGLLIDSYSSIGFPTDLTFRLNRAGGSYTNQVFSRLTGLNSGTGDSPTSGNAYYLVTSSSAAQANSSPYFSQIGDMSISYGSSWSAPTYVLHNYHFRRSPGFMDAVCYTGNGVAGNTFKHNLGVVPELMIVKQRSGAEDWLVYSAPTGITTWSRLNTNLAFSSATGVWNATLPTEDTVTLGNFAWNNGSGATYIAYLFASLAGISKIGSYTGTGSTIQVDCGFSSGARFVMIKRTDSTGNWYYWDTLKGIVTGNDPYSVFNSTAAEVTNTDYIDPYAAGFEVSSSAPAELNFNGGSYIFFAIA